jgi:hypothetical protein
MRRILAKHLMELESAKNLRGPDSPAKAARLLGAMSEPRFRDSASLIRFHDAVLFLRAFPHSPEVLRRTEQLLAGVSREVRRLRESGADMDPFDHEQVSGISGTELRDRFTYDVAGWLKQRYPRQVRAAWDIDEQARPLSTALPRFLPLLEDDSLVEADTPYLTWMSRAAGEGHALEWLLQRFHEACLSPAQRTELYDALGIELRWELEDGPASRTFARRATLEPFFHTEPMIRRNQVSLGKEFASPQLPVRKLSAREGEEILNMCRDAVTVRYRELYGTTRGDPAQVIEANPGRGVQIFLWGLPPERRLPLRAYHAGFTLKNGVPINYIEGISLFEWMEIGFNTFYAYRDGETAWIYSTVLHFLHQLTGVTCLSVYPYQIGHENEEAIKSGAFWFYRKLGFRPGRPDLLALVEKEERKIAGRPAYRTSASTLRRLAAGHIFYEVGGSGRGCWDTFATRNLGFAVQKKMKEAFAGDAGRMRQAASAALSQWLKVDLGSWGPVERGAFENFAILALVAPELKQGNRDQQQLLLEIIRAKSAADEIVYLRMLRQHESLRETLLRIGSAPIGPAKS